MRVNSDLILDIAAVVAGIILIVTWIIALFVIAGY